MKNGSWTSSPLFLYFVGFFSLGFSSLASDRLRPFVVFCVYVSIMLPPLFSTTVENRKRPKTRPCTVSFSPSIPDPFHRRYGIMLHTGWNNISFQFQLPNEPSTLFCFYLSFSYEKIYFIYFSLKEDITRSLRRLFHFSLSLVRSFSTHSRIKV